MRSQGKAIVLPVLVVVLQVGLTTAWGKPPTGAATRSESTALVRGPKHRPGLLRRWARQVKEGFTRVTDRLVANSLLPSEESDEGGDPMVRSVSVGLAAGSLDLPTQGAAVPALTAGTEHRSKVKAQP